MTDERQTPARTVAIVVAAGRGERFGGGVAKQFVEVRGRSLLQRSVDAFAALPGIARVVVVLPAEIAARPGDVLAFDPARVRCVAGGARRQDSVAAGFAAIDTPCDVVLVHDAARPFVTADLIGRVAEAAAAHGAAIAALRARDTVKRGEARGGSWRVLETLPRETLFLAQTPQGFRYEVLAEAIALGRAGRDATDEAALAEAAGRVVVLVEGDPHNIKVTTPADLPLAAAIAASREPAFSGPVATGESEPPVQPRARAHAPALRVGTGYDSHRFTPGRPLVLGGVLIPHEQGLAGHSDADAVCHAVTDAVLGAANLGDIGRLFPDTDPAWEDADSLRMLELAVARVRAAGYDVGNVDIVVVCERPKIAPHADAMRSRLATALGVEPGVVSVKGKTNEGLDATGRGEGLAVHAVATLVVRPVRRSRHVERPVRMRSRQ